MRRRDPPSLDASTPSAGRVGGEPLAADGSFPAAGRAVYRVAVGIGEPAGNHLPTPPIDVDTDAGFERLGPTP